MRKYYAFTALLFANIGLSASQPQSIERMRAITENKRERDACNCLFCRRLFLGGRSDLSRLAGVIETTVGYMNGRTQNPSYRDICYSDTGHAEAVEVVYDPSQVDYACSVVFLALA